MKRFVAMLVGAMFAAGALVTAAGAEEAAAPAPVKYPLAVGQAVPEFSMPSADGAAVKFGPALFGQNDKTVLVFINTACSACRSELTLVNKQAEKNAKLKVYAVSVDMTGKEAVENYKKRFKFSVDYVLDPEFTLAPKFGFNFTPAMVVVGKDGKIQAVSAGYTPGQDDDKLIKMLN